MARTPIMAGNWKMHKTIAEAVETVRDMSTRLAALEGAEKVVCPPFIDIPAVAEALRGTSIKVGAQNMHWEKQGAFTGEVSPAMLIGLVDYVIIGHSERRQYFCETDETVNKKIKAALAYDLTPIVCVGENLEQNEAGQTGEVVSRQVRGAFDGLSADDARRTVIAYEPIWAIGTGRAATAAGANSTIGQNVRGTLSELYGEETAQEMRILYGGSVSPKNVYELMVQPEIDGGLVGGASLKPADFVALVEETAKAKR